MLHVSEERLAALADAEPDAIESAHLASCLVCARERASHRAVLALARAERTRLTPPLSSWEGIASGLAGNGGSGASTRTGRPLPPYGVTHTIMRVAAAILLLVTGLAAGRYSAGAPLLPLAASAPDSALTQVASQASAGEFASEAEAIAVMTRAELQYQRAVAFLGASRSGLELNEKDAIRARLAALDEVATTTQRALNEVPYDPVINSYYLNTLGAREATLRQIGLSMPPGTSLTRY